VADDFDLDHAERVLMSAQTALAHSRGFDRIAQFPNVTEWLGKSLTELKRLRAGRLTMIRDALGELNALMMAQLEDALRRRGSLIEAIKEFRENNYHLRRGDDGKWRWAPKPDSDIHKAIEKLTAATLEAEKSVLQ